MHRLSLLSILLVAALTPVHAQNPVPTSTATATSSTISAQQLASLSASAKVPKLCVTAVQNGQALNFLNNQLCPLYLILSSEQFESMQKAKRENVLRAFKENLVDLIKDPVTQRMILNALLTGYKNLAQQQGASSGASGTTNLVSKPAASILLSIASEYGAVTQTTSGQTSTVSGTVAGLPLALMNKGLLEGCPADIYQLFGYRTQICVNPRLVTELSKISYSVSFNTSTNSQSVTATPSNAGTTSAVPAKFFNGSAPSINAASVKWIAIQGTPSVTAISGAVSKYQSSGVPAAGHDCAMYFQAAFIPHTDEMEPVDEKMLHTLQYTAPSRDKAPTLQDLENWKNLASRYVTFLSGRTDKEPAGGIPENISPEDAAKDPFLQKTAVCAVVIAESLGEELTVSTAMARPAILSFEYDDNLPTSQPSNSVVRGIYQSKIDGWTLTANGAISFYNTQPTNQVIGAGRLRDFQVAFEADHDFTIPLPTGKTTVTGSGAFYDQDQTSPAILNVTAGSPVDGVTFIGLPSTATQVYAQKGNIAIGQFRLSIGTGSNIHVPLSVTYSNRTELVTSPVWRGQIGISYDFDSLFSKSGKQ